MRKKLSKEYNLSIMNPSLAREWHTYRNRNITPSDVTPNQGLKVWWKCKYGHEWQSTIAHRNAGRGCPYCSGKKVNMDNCLETKYPRLAKEWHHFRNGRLTSKDVTAGSNKKVWWICNNGHEWQATISNRTKGSGCPYCSGRLADKNNSLLKLNHKLAKEWHPTLNNKLKSNDVRPGSSKKIWWLCSKGHEWEATVSSRNTGIGCPYCSGRFADDETCLTKTNPVLAKEWHPVKNEKITPNDVKAGSHLKVWWLCKKGHEWQAVIGSRNTGVGCPFCHYKTSQIEIRIFTEIKFIFEDASHRKKIFGSECDIYLPTQKIGIEVDSFYWHKNKFISDLKKTESLAKHGILLIRIRERGLKEISKNDIFYSSKEDVLSVIKRLIRKIGISEFIDRGKIFQLNHYLKNNNFANNEEFKRLLNLLPFPFPGYSLSDSNKELSKEWHPSKNIDLTPNDVYANAGLKVWWICSKGHEWQATIDHRNKGRGCPYCAGQKICVDNCLKTINPRLAKEWHPTKNGKLTPNDVTANTRRKVFWICIRGHVWKASIASRNKGSGCPFCAGKKACDSNCLLTINPTLSKEWNLPKNRSLTPKDVTASSSKKVWWICKKEHEWKAYISDRNRGSGCPFCSGKRAFPDNCLQNSYPNLAEQWHPIKNGRLNAKMVTKCSGKSVWWLCKKGHEWEAKISNRVNGRDCPYCAGKKAGYDNCLNTLNPILASEWNYKRNGNLTPKNVTQGSNKKVWWICKNGHEWQAVVYSRIQGSNCPYCSGRAASNENCLQSTNPEIAKEWNFKRNKNITPHKVTHGSNKMVWWVCKKGHEWQETIKNRSRGSGCPNCRSRLKVEWDSIARDKFDL